MLVKSEAWNRAWNIELREDGTAALSPGWSGRHGSFVPKLQRIGADIIEG